MPSDHALSVPRIVNFVYNIIIFKITYSVAIESVSVIAESINIELDDKAELLTLSLCDLLGFG